VTWYAEHVCGYGLAAATVAVVLALRFLAARKGRRRLALPPDASTPPYAGVERRKKR